MSDIYDLAAHLDEFDGTLVRRGTPVEKHCSKLSRMLSILVNFIGSVKICLCKLLFLGPKRFLINHCACPGK
jgi:hypothetical protein